MFDVGFETTNILWCLNTSPLFSFFLVTPLSYWCLCRCTLKSGLFLHSYPTYQIWCVSMHTRIMHVTCKKSHVTRPSSQYDKDTWRELDTTLKHKDRLACVTDAVLDTSDHTCHKFVAEIVFTIFVQQPYQYMVTQLLASILWTKLIKAGTYLSYIWLTSCSTCENNQSNKPEHLTIFILDIR